MANGVASEERSDQTRLDGQTRDGSVRREHVAARRPCVLMVDDDPDVCETVRIGLSARGFNVVIATDFLMALGVEDHMQPDAIILDLNLPTADGESLSYYFTNERAYRRTVPIIIYSGVADSKRRKLALSCGAAEVIPKDASIKRLYSAVLRHLRAAPTP